MFKQNGIQRQKELSEKYKIEDMFKTIVRENKNTSEEIIVKDEKNIFYKMLDKIKNWFKKKGQFYKMNNIIIGNAISIIAAIIMVYTGTLKNKKKIILIQSFQIFLLTISNFVLGGMSGAIVNIS